MINNTSNKTKAHYSLEKHIFADQVKWLYNTSQLTIGFNFLVGIFLCLILWPTQDHLLLMGWYSFLLLTLIVRLVIVYNYKLAKVTTNNARSWGILHGVAIVSTGIAWGSAGVLLYGYTIVHQAFLAFIIAGMASGAIAVFSAILPIAFAYLAILLLPFLIRLSLDNNEVHWTMALLVFLFSVSMIQVTRSIHTTIRNGIKLKFQNKNLIEELSTEKEQIESLNIELQIRNQAIEASTDGIFIIKGIHPDYPIIYANQAFIDITGNSSEQIIGKSCLFLEDTMDPMSFFPIRTALYAHRPGYTLLHRQNKTGEPCWLELHLTPIAGVDETTRYFVGSLWDVSAHKHLEEYLAYQATHDELTSLPNRVLLSDRLQQDISKAERNKTKFGVIFSDIDYFKNINDTYGHKVGDELLCAYAKRLRGCVRESDTVGRLGGDEFLILISPIYDKNDLIKVAQKILNETAKPFELDNVTLSITTSIGISIYPQDGTTPSVLLSEADLALYNCKESGRNTFKFCNK